MTCDRPLPPPSLSSSTLSSPMLHPPLPAPLFLGLLLLLLLLLSFPPSASPFLFSSSPSSSALLIIDMQRCFSSDGSLPVPGFASLLPIINRLHALPFFSHVILSQDWHPPNHVSFAANHAGHAAFSTVELHYDAQGRLCEPSELSTASECAAGAGVVAVNQTLWPVHCVMGSADAELHPQLLRLPGDFVVQKGSLPHIDSYSAFHDALATSWTDLPALLSGLGVHALYVAGVALDYCVMATALDGVEGGWEVSVIRDATAAIGDGEREMERMAKAGVRFVDSREIEGYAASNSAGPATTAAS